MKSDSTQKIKKYFDKLYRDAKTEARAGISGFIQNLSDDLPLAQRVMKLHNRLCVLNQEIEDFERKEYIHFTSFKTVIYKLFSSNLLFFEKNDHEAIKGAFILNEKRNTLIKLYQEEKSRLSPFTYSDFLGSRDNVIFYRIHQKPPGTSEEEYLKMRNWQTQKKIECVNLESKKFKRRFINSLGTGDKQTQSIKAEIDQVEHLFKDAAELTPDQFSLELIKLKGTAGVCLPADKNKFYESFCSFIEGDILSDILTPHFLNSQLTRIQTGKISYPPVCSWSLIKYLHCLKKLLPEQSGTDELNDPDYGQMFEQTYIKGIRLAEKRIKEFKSKYVSDVIPVKDYKEILMKKLDTLRKEFNNLVYPDYYHFLLDKETVRIFFSDNCLYGDNTELHREELKKAVVLNETILFFMEELQRVHESPIHLSPEKYTLVVSFQVVDLITSMVPSTGLMSRLVDGFSRAISHLKSGRKPVLFIIEDLKESLRDIYNKAAADLTALFRNDPSDRKAQFALRQLRDLELKRLTAKRNNRELHEYVGDLKQIFKIEIEFLQAHKKYDSGNIDHLLEESDVPYRKKLSFRYGKSDPQILYPVIQALCVKIDFLDNRTAIEDFIRIVTAGDLEPVTEKIYIGCRTNEFKYTLKHFRDYFKSFNPATIEKSGIFMTKNDVPINAGNLYSAEIENLQTKVAIDNIFKQKQ